MSEDQTQDTMPKEDQSSPTEKKRNIWGWVVALIIIIVGGYFLTTNINKPGDGNIPAGEDINLEELRTSIDAEPVVGENLPYSDEQIETFKRQLIDAQEEVRSVDYDTLQGVNGIAQLKRQLGDVQGAIDAWEYANAIRPQNSLSFSNLAALYHFDLNEFEKAEEMYRISVDNDPDDLLTIRNFYELYHYSMKDDVKAEALLEEARNNNPEAVDMYTLSGRFYTETGNIVKAIEVYENALALDPDNVNVNREIQQLKSLQ